MAIPKHEYGTFEERKSIVDHMLTPDFPDEADACKDPMRSAGADKIAALRYWLDHVIVAREALIQEDYTEAHKNFQAALVEAERLGPTDLRLKETLLSLADFLKTRGELSKSQALYDRAARMVVSES